jgi:predicted CopG family antitoxin
LRGKHKEDFKPVSYPIRTFRISDEILEKMKRAKKTDSWDTLFKKLLEDR